MNPLIAPSLEDETETNDSGKNVYSYDCANLPICKSYGDHFFSCLRGACEGKRCSHAEKIKIRILNDMNPSAIYKPTKPSKAEISDYVNG